MTVIIDYGMGNLRSVQKAMEYIGEKAVITEDPKELSKAERIILPGVGAFSHAMKKLKELKIDEAIKKEVSLGKPILGICLGMQLFFEKSYENGENEGLSLLPGDIVKIDWDVKVPHVGWNSLIIEKESELFKGLPENPYVYFVHSYYLKEKGDVVSAKTDYGKKIAVAAEKDNIYALQFHPEKSGDCGLEILRNFGRIK